MKNKSSYLILPHGFMTFHTDPNTFLSMSPLSFSTIMKSAFIWCLSGQLRGSWPKCMSNLLLKPRANTWALLACSKVLRAAGQVHNISNSLLQRICFRKNSLLLRSVDWKNSSGLRMWVYAATCGRVHRRWGLRYGIDWSPLIWSGGSCRNSSAPSSTSPMESFWLCMP